MPVIRLNNIIPLTNVIKMTNIIPLTNVIKLNNVISREFHPADLDAAIQAVQEPDPAPIPRYDPEPEPEPAPLSPQEDSMWFAPASLWSRANFLAQTKTTKVVNATSSGVRTPRVHPARATPPTPRHATGSEERPPPAKAHK